MGFFKKIEQIEEKSPEEPTIELVDLRRAIETARITKAESARKSSLLKERA